MCSDYAHTKKQCPPPGNDIHYPGQTNHDACFIPECVRQYAGDPLYIIVAHWCLLQQDWVQRNQISEAFHITARRASYLVAYLRNKTNRVDCECRRSVLVNKVARYEIRVTDIKDGPPVKKGNRSSSLPVSRRRVGNAGTDRANKLWNQLCLRRKAGLLLKKT
ncbi:CaiF/GrlA family transcriptional regulator [Salmonella enterica]|nr:CaiF/GrlA family transcriptional regulator [Salmonella enterica]